MNTLNNASDRYGLLPDDYILRCKQLAVQWPVVVDDSGNSHVALQVGEPSHVAVQVVDTYWNQIVEDIQLVWFCKSTLGYSSQPGRNATWHADTRQFEFVAPAGEIGFYLLDHRFEMDSESSFVVTSGKNVIELHLKPQNGVSISIWSGGQKLSFEGWPRLRVRRGSEELEQFGWQFGNKDIHVYLPESGTYEPPPNQLTPLLC